MNAVNCPDCRNSLDWPDIAVGRCQTCKGNLPNAIIRQAVGAPPAPLDKPPPNILGLSDRAVGLILTLLGVFMGFLCILKPLEAAAQKQSNVSITMKGAAVVPVALGLGLIYLVFGNDAAAALGRTRNLKPLGWLVVIGLVAAGVVLYFWLQSAVQREGYVFS